MHKVECSVKLVQLYKRTCIVQRPLIDAQRSRHKVACRVTQENGAPANRVSELTGKTKLQFSHIRSSVMPYPNDTKITVELASNQRRPHGKFV